MGYKGGRGFNRGPRKMYKSVCIGCGKECEVPIRQTGDRPIYCQECWAERKPLRTEDHHRREYRREDRQIEPSPAPENIDLQILGELKRIREVLEKGIDQKK